MKLTIPDGWEIVDSGNWYWAPPYGRAYYHVCKILLYRPAWAIWPIRGWIRSRIVQHELAHAWGVKGCKKPWCLCFEAGTWKSKWKDIWWEGFLMVLSTINPWTFCKEHREFLKEKMDALSGNNQ